MNFTFHTPTQIIFGADTLKSTNEHVKNLGKKCLIVTGKKAMKKFGHLDRLKKILIIMGNDPPHHHGDLPNNNELLHKLLHHF